MSVRVSVVVPVLNPGPHIDPLIDSLRRQTMPASDFEAVFVDDGSTDETPAKLDRLAETEPNVTVVHIPNSGWPGRPRNIGIETATGEYIQFVDHDDELGVEALERLYAYAKENESDVVIGKEVRPKAGLKPLFYENRPRAELGKDPILSILTPHKMFRREFLNEHKIRFLEGPRRLEDHPFVVEAYFQAKVISVLADYPVYYWNLRRDRGNAGIRPADWGLYYRSLRDVLDVVERHTQPGDFRDRLLSFWYQGKGLSLLAKHLPDLPVDQGRQLFDSLRDLTRERFPASVDRHLPGDVRIRSQLLRAGDFDAMLELTRLEKQLAITQTLLGLDVHDDMLRVRVRAGICYGDGSPVVLDAADGRMSWRPPADRGETATVSPRDFTRQYRNARVDLLLRNQATRESVIAHGAVTPARPAPAGTPLAFHADFSVDLGTALHGDPLPPGIYDLHVRVRAGSWAPQAPLRGDARSRADAPSSPEHTRRAVVPFTTRNGHVALAVDQEGFAVLGLGRPDLAAATLVRRGGAVELRVPLDASDLRGRRVRGRLRLVPEGGGEPATSPLRVVPQTRRRGPRLVSSIPAARIPPRRLGARRWRLEALFEKQRERLGVVLEVRPGGDVLLSSPAGRQIARAPAPAGRLRAAAGRLRPAARRLPGLARAARVVRRAAGRSGRPSTRGGRDGSAPEGPREMG